MRQYFGNTVLVIAALFFFFTTWTAGTQPARFAQSLGLSVANSGGINEIRAQYAGFFCASALLCLAALFGAVPQPWAFIVLIVIFAGLIGGRLVSLALNGGTSGYPPVILALYVMDALGLLLSVTALTLSRTAAAS
jgi:hypothetical protein